MYFNIEKDRSGIDPTLNRKELAFMKPLTFTVKNAHRSFCSALRRALMADVITYAFDQIEITRTNSVLFNSDIITHIIMGVPILPWKDLSDEELLMVRFTIDHEVSDNETIYRLTSNDIKSSNPKVSVFPDIPLFILRPGEHFTATITPNFGTARDDALKFGAVENVEYKWIDFSFDDNGHYLFDHDNKYKNEPNPIVEYMVSPVRNYDALTTVKMAVQSIIDQLESLDNELSNEEFNNIHVTSLDKSNDTEFIEILIDNADDTIGNLLNCEMIVNTPDLFDVGSCAYQKDHPTRDLIRFKIRYTNPLELFHTAIKDQLQFCNDFLKDIN